MGLTSRARIVAGILGLVGLLIGFGVSTSPAEFSGAQVGEAMECNNNVCQVMDGGAVIFEGTEQEAIEWSEAEDAAATRPIVIGSYVVGGLLLLAAIMPTRRAAGS